jgi:hypothetical protein
MLYKAQRRMNEPESIRFYVDVGFGSGSFTKV